MRASCAETGGSELQAEGTSSAKALRLERACFIYGAMGANVKEWVKGEVVGEEGRGSREPDAVETDQWAVMDVTLK